MRKYEDRISDGELNELGSRLFGSGYVGAFSKDEVKLDRPGVYIINLQSTEQTNYEGQTGGTHWTSLLYMGKLYFYFDSFGFPPPQTILKQLRGSKGVYFSGIAQPWLSDLCGYYDLYAMNAIINGGAAVRTDGEIYLRNNKLLFKHVHDNDKAVRVFANSLHN